MSLFPDAVPTLRETEHRARQTELDAAGRRDLRAVAYFWALLIALAVVVFAVVRAVLS